MNQNPKTRRTPTIIALFSACVCLSLGLNSGSAEERVLKLDKSKMPRNFGDNSPTGPVYRYTPLRLGDASFGSREHKKRVEEANNKRIQAESFTVYTTEESYNRSEIDKKLATDRDAASKQMRDAVATAKTELATTKADMLKAISESVGRQLSAEELAKIKAALLPEIREQLKAELADELKTQLKAEIFQELRGGSR